ncbi:hypothetical protein [Erythrobacter sp.]|uniref:hypothetical protein n=1 Tax=Erythrobacter sp. TaxID=1042 RepID=UPI00311FD7B5
MIRQLTFINRAECLEGSEVVLFQKNRCANDGMDDIAWRRIRHCPEGWHHPFTYSCRVECSTTDAFGNFSPPIPANEGSVFEIRKRHDDRPVLRRIPLQEGSGISVTNRMWRGSLDVNILRDSHVLARWPGLPPMQTAHFGFDPDLWVGLGRAPQSHEPVQKVQSVRSATRLSLRQVRTADIVMSGGRGRPIGFHLENVNSG